MTARPRVLLDPATLTALRVPAGYVRQAVGFFAKTDEARAGLMATAGVAPTALDAADGTMSLADELALVGALNTRIGRHWAVEALPIWAPASQGALDLAARSAATIGEGLALAAQYAPARAPQFAATFDTATDPATLTIALRVAVDAEVGAAMCEAATLSAVAMIASLADGPLTSLAYDWPWTPPAHAEALRQAAPGTHLFNAATCTLHVPHAIADQPSPHRDAGLLAATIANLETAKAQDPSMPVGHRLAALLASPEGPMTSAADAAKHLGLSGRTLARRLTEEGTSFRAKRDEALKAHAEVLLADKRLSRDAIAERLGFDDPTSFSRACRRWFGEGPRAVRQRMDGGLTPRQ